MPCPSPEHMEQSRSSNEPDTAVPQKSTMQGQLMQLAYPAFQGTHTSTHPLQHQIIHAAGRKLPGTSALHSFLSPKLCSLCSMVLQCLVIPSSALGQLSIHPADVKTIPCLVLLLNPPVGLPHTTVALEATAKAKLPDMVALAHTSEGLYV